MGVIIGQESVDGQNDVRDRYKKRTGIELPLGVMPPDGTSDDAQKLGWSEKTWKLFKQRREAEAAARSRPGPAGLPGAQSVAARPASGGKATRR